MAQVADLQAEQDFIAASLINRGEKFPLYFLLGALEIYLKTLAAKSGEWTDTIGTLLTKKYDGLTFYGVLETYCGSTDPYTTRCKQLVDQLAQNAEVIAAQSMSM